MITNRFWLASDTSFSWNHLRYIDFLGAHLSTIKINNILNNYFFKMRWFEISKFLHHATHVDPNLKIS